MTELEHSFTNGLHRGSAAENLRRLIEDGAGWDDNSMSGVQTPRDLFENGEGDIASHAGFKLYLVDLEETYTFDAFRDLVHRAIAHAPKGQPAQHGANIAEFDRYIDRLKRDHAAYIAS